jgi:hypothetical protein
MQPNSVGLVGWIMAPNFLHQAMDGLEGGTLLWFISRVELLLSLPRWTSPENPDFLRSQLPNRVKRYKFSFSTSSQMRFAIGSFNVNFMLIFILLGISCECEW